MTKFQDSEHGIEISHAVESLGELRKASLQTEGLVKDAADKERLAKYEHALAVVQLENANTPTKVPATVRKEHALTRDSVQEALKAADTAKARLIGFNAKCDWHLQRINLIKALMKEKV